MARLFGKLTLASLLSLALISMVMPADVFAQRPQRPQGPPRARRGAEMPERAQVPDDWSQKIEWRSIGPANMSGRITALAVYEKDPSIWWAASASGGLLKTTNAGVTFEHQFDDQATVSIGDVQVSQWI